MLSSNNINIISKAPLTSPKAIKSELPLSLDAVAKVIAARQEICDILLGKSKKVIMIVGPCSIHNRDSALEYARKLNSLREKVSDKIFIIMRTYFEKPRTTIGWKGMIYDPDINGSYNIEKGIFLARKLLLQIVDLGVPVATEMLDLIIPQYVADAVSWAAIGARTTESQTHRQLASGLSMPVGFKNATDGNLQVAIDAINTANSQHSFIGVTEEGQIGVFRTAGNSFGHIVLRGGSQPNYSAEYIAFLKVILEKAKIKCGIIVDCSHANSGKQHEMQKTALEDVIQQICNGEDRIAGVMLESNLKPGSQKIVIGETPDPEVSITDACIGWEETEELILSAYKKLNK
jgi:3-deoxy-7-phosphoheptulonate synthase